MAAVDIGRVRPRFLSRVFRSKWGKAGIALLILNEIRGLIVVALVGPSLVADIFLPLFR